VKALNTRTLGIVVAVLLVSSCLTAFCLRNLGIGPSTYTISTTSYVVVDTGQNKCYNNMIEISNPQPGEAFYGQDAQYTGNAPSYTLSADGLTVYDNVTSLTWTQSPDLDGDGDIDFDDKLTFSEFLAYPATLNAQNYGGYSDWRAPTIKELYSLIDFRGGDPSSYQGSDTSVLTPFIDTNYFDFGYGDTSVGERIIDAQYWSSTQYVATTMNGDATVFGVNFADGRIKGYPRDINPMLGGDMKEYARFVRGNADYGDNQFVANGDGTVTDNATGLMWRQADSGAGINWEEALAWVQTKNAENYLGHSDWRLPNAKELQSIVDYTRSPSTNGSAAIDPVFTCTSIINEAGQADYPFYWTGTTHVRSGGSGGEGVYVAFGRAMGYMNGAWIDVHGAGAQRSDPKSGNPADYPYGRGPQGDAVRIYNYVRLLRDANAPHVDVAITDIAFSEQNPTVNETIVINVTVENQGDYTEAFNVSVYYTRLSDPLVGTQAVTNLPPSENTTLTFEWAPDITGRYEILANTTEIPNDVDTTDNTRTTIVYVGYGGSSLSSQSTNSLHSLNLLMSFIFIMFGSVTVLGFRKNKQISLSDMPASILKQNLHNKMPYNTTNIWHDWTRRQSNIASL